MIVCKPKGVSYIFKKLYMLAFIPFSPCFSTELTLNGIQSQAGVKGLH